jgi:hypothetical protein
MSDGMADGLERNAAAWLGGGQQVLHVAFRD